MQVFSPQFYKKKIDFGNFIFNFMLDEIKWPRWLNTDAKIEDHLLEYDSRSKTLMSQNEEGIVIVEYRDLDGTVIHFEEPEFSEATGRKLHKVDINKAEHGLDNIVAMDFTGNIFKTKFWKNYLIYLPIMLFFQLYLYIV